MANIRPEDLPAAVSVPDDVALIIDNGVNVLKATPVQVVDSGRPLANQAEAEAGSNPTKAMTPLTTAQAIAAQGAVQFATAAQGGLADSAVQPGDLGALATKDQISVPGDIDATGTPSSATYLAGDGEWRTPPGAGDMEKAVYDPSSTNLDLANVPRVDAAQSFSQSQINQLLSNAGVQIRQIAAFASATAGSTSTNTAYGGTLGNGQTLTPKSATSSLIVLCYGAANVTRSAGGLASSMRVGWYNGSVWSGPSGIWSFGQVGQNNTGTTATNQSGGVSVFAVLGPSEKNGSGQWNFVLTGSVSTTGNSPLLSVDGIRYIAIEVEGL